MCKMSKEVYENGTIIFSKEWMNLMAWLGPSWK